MSAGLAREAADARLVAEAVQAVLRLAGQQQERKVGQAGARKVLADCGEGATSLRFSVELDAAACAVVGVEHRGTSRRVVAECRVALPAGALLAAAGGGVR
jgi:hypothetical protein